MIIKLLPNHPTDFIKLMEQTNAISYNSRSFTPSYTTININMIEKKLLWFADYHRLKVLN